MRELFSAENHVNVKDRDHFIQSVRIFKKVLFPVENYVKNGKRNCTTYLNIFQCVSGQKDRKNAVHVGWRSFYFKEWMNFHK